MDGYAEEAARNLAALRANKPLIHNITNFVVMNFTANALLAMGASPVMAHAPDEVEEMVGLAGALVLNIGTLTAEWVDSMLKAGKAAAARNIPVVLDPVGAGATALRTRSAGRIISAVRPQVIRGNASEVLSLRDASSKTKGVDTRHSVDDAAPSAQALARELHATLAITGPIDLVTDGTRMARVANGHPLMGRVTGTGCTATATVAAFLAVDPDPLRAAVLVLQRLRRAGDSPHSLPIFLDSPMAIAATAVTLRHRRLLAVPRREIETLTDGVHFIETGAQSQRLSRSRYPSVIISASGMATGGRVLHHLQAMAPNEHHHIVFPGFQAAGTRGARMVAGEREIKIFGEMVPVRAEVSHLEGFSGHADADELMQWAGGFQRPPRHTFVIHGDPDATDRLRFRLGHELGWRASVPPHAQTVEI